MFYGCTSWLVAERHLIRSIQGTQPGNPLGMFLFSLVIQPLIEDLAESCTLDTKVWCADVGTLIGPILELVKAMSTLKDVDVTLGYHLEVK